MRALIQRVAQASVAIGGQPHSAIHRGLLVFLGVEVGDTPADAAWLAGKVARLRIFADATGAMNRSVIESDGAVMVISQFTLHASTHRGNRPSYSRAAGSDAAVPLYDAFVADIAREIGRPPACGVFGADMQVGLVNDGPVTLMIDSRLRE